MEQLISEVEKRPVLWDTSDEKYKDRNKNNEAWLDVTSALYEHYFVSRIIFNADYAKTANPSSLNF